MNPNDRGSFSVQLSKKDLSGVNVARQVQVLHERETSQRATRSRKASLQKEMTVIIDINLSALWHHIGSCKLGQQVGNCCFFLKKHPICRVAKRFVKEREKTGHTVGIMQQSGKMC